MLLPKRMTLPLAIHLELNQRRPTPPSRASDLLRHHSIPIVTHPVSKNTHPVSTTGHRSSPATHPASLATHPPAHPGVPLGPTTHQQYPLPATHHAAPPPASVSPTADQHHLNGRPTRSKPSSTMITNQLGTHHTRLSSRIVLRQTTIVITSLYHATVRRALMSNHTHRMPPLAVHLRDGILPIATKLTRLVRRNLRISTTQQRQWQQRRRRLIKLRLRMRIRRGSARGCFSSEPLLR